MGLAVLSASVIGLDARRIEAGSSGWSPRYLTCRILWRPKQAQGKIEREGPDAPGEKSGKWLVSRELIKKRRSPERKLRTQVKEEEAKLDPSSHDGAKHWKFRWASRPSWLRRAWSCKSLPIKAIR